MKAEPGIDPRAAEPPSPVGEEAAVPSGNAAVPGAPAAVRAAAAANAPASASTGRAASSPASRSQQAPPDASPASATTTAAANPPGHAGRPDAEAASVASQTAASPNSSASAPGASGGAHPPLVTVPSAPSTTAAQAVVTSATKPQPAPAPSQPAPAPGQPAPAFAQQPAPSAGAATTASASPAVPVAAYGVRLAQAAEKLANAVSLGARNGVSIARIQLAPASLGSIQIQLQHTDDGIVAHVLTEHPEAAAALAGGSEQLRQSLQQAGTPLLRLEIQTANQQGAAPQQQPGGASNPHAGDSRSRGGRVPRDSGAGDDDATAAINQIPTHGLTSASLVNVLA